MTSSLPFQPMTNGTLRVLQQTYAFQPPSAMSIHQRQLLEALTELLARRMGEWICPRCHHRQDPPKGQPEF